MAIPISTQMAMAARNEIVRLTGQCAISIEVIWAAIEAAQAAEKAQIARNTAEQQERLDDWHN
jgi:hypothetical protein